MDHWDFFIQNTKFQTKKQNVGSSEMSYISCIDFTSRYMYLNLDKMTFANFY